jgi:zinc D-Ala-D-Ala carboxypeptidase|tara:strand:+ start:11859 stop:12320 length:462 start_codon:yes stop_codon:yes gene_type:complete
MDKISKHISYKEATRSNTALRRGIENIPDVEQLENMKLIAEKVFEPLRKHVGGPIKINSFYRSPELNVAIGGSKKSQHCKGQAIDLDDTYGHRSNASMFQWMRYHLDYDQMIWEFGDDKNPAWVHVSYVSEEENRHRCLKAVKKNGKTHYELM